MRAITQVKLPAVLDVTGAGELVGLLKSARGAPLVLEASSVEKVSGLGLQVLISARLTWESDGARLAVSAPSAAFQEAMALSGASPFELCESPEP